MHYDDLLAFLEQHQLPYVLYEHAPFFTVADAAAFEAQIPGASSKNLFLKDRKGQCFLVSLLAERILNLKALSKVYGKGGLSFASAPDLLRLLGVLPGAVTPFGLLQDIEQKICFLLDPGFLEYEYVNFHPLRNDRTIGVLTTDFLKFCALVQHTPEYLPLLAV